MACRLSLALLLPLAACAPGDRNVPCRPLGSTGTLSALRAAADASAFRGTVFTVVLENHSDEDLLGASGPPYIRSLASQYAVAAGYTDAFVHPSEPNYLWMAAGENFGVVTDDVPANNHVACTSHIADQVEQAGLDWRSYQQSMGSPCTLVDAYPYAPKHNPFVYFDDVAGFDGTSLTRAPRCQQHVVDYAQLASDLQAGQLPRYVFITPDLLHDMHDGTVQQGDDWLASEIPKILASSAWQNGGVLFLTWDEGSTLGNDHPPMLVISPLGKQGYVSQTAYTTSSYLKTVQAILGVEPLPCSQNPDTVKTMDDVFSVPLARPATPAAQPPTTGTNTNTNTNTNINTGTGTGT
jgi:hypothetical protein